MTDQTITGPTPYEGTYTDVTVVGTNTTVSDDDGNHDTYVLGNENTQPANGNITITASGTSNDTISYSFDVSVLAGQTFNFLDFSHPQLALTGTEQDGTIDGTSNANANAWYSQYDAWIASLGDLGQYQFSGELDVQAWQKAKQGTVVTDVNLDGVIATKAGETTITSNDVGSHDTTLGFAVGSDHIDLGANVTQSIFENYFTVTSTNHADDHGNTIQDTTISLGSDWSVDLYGVDTSALSGQALSDYVFNNLLTHHA
jgi:hypothetical protein